MGAVRQKIAADLRRRRLQTVGIGAIVLLATAAGTLALSILVESHAPFERAFAAANGAHLVVDYRGGLDPATLATTAQATPVTAAAGPWPISPGAVGEPSEGRVIAAQLSGRPASDPAIDLVTVESGHWWTAPGELVLGDAAARILDKQVGDTIRAFGPIGGKTDVGPSGTGASGGRQLTVVGIATSVSTPDVWAWMDPTDLEALLPTDAAPDQQMLYRVTPSASAADLGAAAAAIVQGLPAEAVRSTQTYLDLEVGVDRVADLYVPVLLAFALFALVAAAFLIANVVAGMVLGHVREIGVMKAIGYTPRQVTTILGGQVVAPAIVGGILGVTLGTIVSQPIVADTAASFGLPATAAASMEAIVVVLAAAVITCVVAALIPAWRAGRISPVEAMTRGTAPSSRPGGGRLRRLGFGLPLGLPARLGVSAGVAHPVRATMLFGALVVGVAAATFAIGLDRSLLRVMDDLRRQVASPVRVEIGSGSGEVKPAPAVSGSTGPGSTGPGSGAPEPAAISTAIASTLGVGRSVAIAELQVDVPGLTAASFVGYQGDSSWLGYALIEGRWSTAPGDVMVPTAFLTRTGRHLGDSIPVGYDGRTVQLRLVGEIFDTTRGDRDALVLRGSWSDLAGLDPSITPDSWEVQPSTGVEPTTLRSSLREALGAAADVQLERDSIEDASFLLFLAVVGVMGLVLVAMSLGGVFDTVLLDTRQRAREVAVLKAVGLSPAQVIGMVIATVVPVGLLAGVVGVPIGLVAQRVVLDYMGQVAAGTRIPAEVYDVLPPLALVGLATLGLAIGALGALIPAQRAARAGIAPILQAE